MGKFKEGPYGISIKIAFGKGVLAGICDPGLRDREYIVPGVERVVALAVKFPDFEDCLQMECARDFQADYIVSRNLEDFKSSDIPCVDADEMCRIIESHQL